MSSVAAQAATSKPASAKAATSSKPTAQPATKPAASAYCRNPTCFYAGSLLGKWSACCAWAPWRKEGRWMSACSSRSSRLEGTTAIRDNCVFVLMNMSSNRLYVGWF